MMAALAGPLCGQTPQIASGDDFTAMVDASGNLYTYGSNASGQLGIGDVTDVRGQVQLIEPVGVWESVAVSRSAVSGGTASGSGHVLAIRTDGSLWAWGANDRGQLGNGTTVGSNAPIQINNVQRWVEVAAGTNFSMGRTSSGQVYVWGDNTHGQLARTMNPLDVNGFGLEANLSGIAVNLIEIPVTLDGYVYDSIAAGLTSAVAVRDDGYLYTWGFSSTLQLGYPSSASNEAFAQATLTPYRVGNSDGWTKVFSGNTICFGLQGGKLYSWGGDGHTGTGSHSYTPARVGSATDWETVSIGYDHTLALKDDGELWGWGNNKEGALGLPIDHSAPNSNEFFYTPKRLESGTTFLAIGAGLKFSSVFTAGGFLLTSGVNDVGQLGDGSAHAGFQYDFLSSQLGTADLVGTGVTIATALPWTTSSVSASFSMMNAGTGSIETPFYISAVLSSSPNYESADALQLEFAPGETTLEVTDTLTAGQSLSVPFSFILPASVVQGDYYLVVRADSTELIEETSELNNDGATEETYEFSPDLVVSSLTVTGGSYFPGNDLIFDVEIENLGTGTIPAGATFDLRLFLSPDKTSDNSAAVDLDAAVDDDLVTVYTVVLTDELAPGVPPLELTQFDLEIPRMPGGFYFLGADVDVGNVIAEQTEVIVNNVVVRENGEDNNLSFTATALIEVDGIEIPVAIDQEDLSFNTTGDANWFGQTFVYNNDSIAAPGNDDAVQSPSLQVGESAEFSTDFEDTSDLTWETVPYAITFDWKAETSSVDNKLIYRVINGATGGFINEISGITEWTTVQRVVPANARAEWVYEQGAEAIGDAAFVDNLKITEITDPDLVIDDIYLPDGASGSYVLLRDRLDVTVNSRNQGTDTALDDDYVISIYLSKDRTFDRPDSNPATADDILIRQEVIPGGIASGDPAVNGFSILLDAALDDGDYYVIGYIDDYTDAVGDLLPGATEPVAPGDPAGYVSEFVDGAISFDGEANNLFVSSGTIEIVALPDLIVSDLNANPDYYLIEDPITGEANSMEFDFTVANIGITAVNSNVATHVLFSEDQVIEPESDYLLLDYNYNGNFGALDDAPANERLISPDAIDFREDLIDAGYIGRRLFVGVYIDSDLEVDELDEDHNSSYLLNNDFILSELPIADALDLDSATITEQSITVVNDEVAPYDSELIPWVGQTTDSVDGFDAVTNVIINDDEISQFSLNIEPTTGIRLSFWWKVSSEYNFVNGVTHVDTLNFEVDGVAAVAPIFGTDDEEWRRVEVSIDPGPHTLTWSYEKDDQGSEGEDRGWVDNLVIEELPNLTVTGVTADGLPVYAVGDTIDTWSVTIQNTGAAIEAGTSFYVPVRLLPQDSWSESGAAVDLLMITDPNTAGMAAGETRTYNAAEDLGSGALGVLTLPDVDYAQEFYFLGAYVDWSLADFDNGQIIEFDETDNSAVTDESSIQIGLPDLTGDSSSITGLDPSYAFGDSVDIDLTFTNTGDGSLAAGSDFDYTVYIAQTNDDLLLETASVVVLGSGTATVATDVASDLDLDSSNLVADLPFGLAEGNYYLGVEIDVNNDVEEQGLRPDGTGVNGETNNFFFSQIAVFQVTGISLQTALDDGTSPLALGTFENVPDSAAFWFGRDNAGDAPIDDDQIFEQGEGAQSPALNEGDQASFKLLVPVSSVVKFDWGIFSGSDLNVLSVLVNGVVIDSIAGNEPFAAVDPGILVPDNGIVEWRYSQGVGTQGDFAVVDNVRVEINSQPDLVVSAINYTPGEYILDVAGYVDAPNQLLGTEYLDITVEATNQGVDVIATEFTSADLEIRLSVDQIYGNGDDILLGTVSQVEGDFESGSLMRFIGPVQLGDSIPEDTYYLIAKIDSNDALAEFSEGNNIFITENRDVDITRLPALRIYNPNPLALTEWPDGVNNYLDPRESGVVEVAFDLDEDLQYYSEAPMRLRYRVQNIGLDVIEADETWATQVSLLGAKREALADAVLEQDIIDAFTVSIELGDFNVQQLLEGRTAANPTGDIIDFDVELALPNGARLVDIIEEDEFISDYLWIISIDLDSTDAVQQSEIIRESPGLIAPAGNPWWIINLGEALGTDVFASNTTDDEGMFGINSQPFLVSADDWENLYFGYPTIDEEYFLAYAFNRNPADGDTASGQFPGTYGITTVDADDVFSITFDVVTRTTDISYVVEAADELPITPTADGYTVLATIDGPYDELTGSSSLTGDGGLIDEPNVLGVLDQGYSARITIRDDQVVGATSSRFLQVSVTNDQLEAAWALVAASITDPSLRGLYDDGDGDGELNIIEWLTGNLGFFAIPDGVFATEEEILVASYFASRGIVPLAANRGPFDDYDSDGYDNLLEIAFGFDATVGSSTPALSPLEEFVFGEFIALGIIPGIDGVLASDLEPDADFDDDGKSNIIELQNDTDPADGGDTPATDAVDDLVAEYFANSGVFGNPAPADIAPSDDFDSGGASNLAEIALGTNPDDGGADDSADVDLDVDTFIDANYSAGTYTAAGNPDGDIYNNLEEIALGTDPTVFNP